MTSLPTKKCWKKSLLLLFLLLAFPLFFFGGPDYFSPRLLRELWNLGHFFFFAIFAALLDSYWCAKQRSVFFRIITVFTGLFLVGLSTELIQMGVPGRSFAWIDLFRDVTGGLAFLFWRISTSVSSVQSVLYKTAAMALLLANIIPLGGMALDEYRARKDFPLLAGFENKSELTRWKGDAELSQSSFVSVQGGYSGKIRLTTDQYSGISLHHFPGNWSNMKGLVFSIFNPGSQIELYYRIHDNLHRGDMQMYNNRFNGRTTLDPGWNEISIVMTDIASSLQGRTMNLTQIEGFGIFVISLNERRVLYIDNLRLFSKLYPVKKEKQLLDKMTGSLR